MPENYRVEMINIRKSFGGVHALKDVNFRVKAGEIHALVGENGAGKSTMMKILSGVHQKDAGTIFIDGKETHIENPYRSKALGIGIIYQELALAPHLTVAENIFISDLSKKCGIINYHDLYERADKLISKLGFKFDSRQIVGDLTVAYQQVTEIAKVLSQEVNILILDEPTAVLAPVEVDQLLKILLKLRDEGVSVIYISHRLDEVFRIADNITVMKDGSTVKTFPAACVTKDEIITSMIGRQLDKLFPTRETSIGKEILCIKNMNRGKKVRNISINLREGEVLGIAGLVGSGRSELVRALFGADKKESGDIFLEGKKINISCCKDAVKHGIGFVPENRKEEGVLLSMSIKKNMTMTILGEVIHAIGIIKKKKEKAITVRMMNELRIKAESPETDVMNLSGRNQQKVVLGKWLNTDCKVLILDEPTRGVDVGAKYEIYTLINELSKKGIGIIMISSEMIEIIGMCDRTLVMHEGEICGEVDKAELCEEKIMKLAIHSC